MAREYFYDAQIRRFILQFVRLFSNFQVEMGAPKDNGIRDRITVPIAYGDISRNVAHIMRDASENKTLAAPRMACYITALTYQRDRVQTPTYVDKLTVKQRKFDEATQSYTNVQGNAVTIERNMPVPYELRINLDIWTTNMTMKLQLLEQILCLFNPDFEIQSTDNFVDWTSLSYVHLEETTFSSKSIPVGDSDQQPDIATIEFSMPIWISMPANVTKLGVIHKIINSIHDSDGDLSSSISNDDLVNGTRLSVTPGRYGAILLNNQAELVDYESNNITLPWQAGMDYNKGECVIYNDKTYSVTEDYRSGNSFNLKIDKLAEIKNPETFNKPSWRGVLEQYGQINTGISQIRFEQPNGTEVIGTIAFHPTNPQVLLLTINQDTIPSNTLEPIDAIIRPSTASSSNVIKQTGKRYLIIEDIGESSITFISADNATTDNIKLKRGVGDDEETITGFMKKQDSNTFYKPGFAILKTDRIFVNDTMFRVKPANDNDDIIDAGEYSLQNTDGADFWKNTDMTDLVARKNDIISWNGSRWDILFNTGADTIDASLFQPGAERSETTENIQYITNIKTGIQYKWTESNWIKSFEGEYRPLNWRLVI